jgi:hypothetical protein
VVLLLLLLLLQLLAGGWKSESTRTKIRLCYLVLFLVFPVMMSRREENKKNKARKEQFCVNSLEFRQPLLFDNTFVSS